MSYKIINNPIPVLHGHLESVIFKPEYSERAMIVTHPHPLFGGNMHNKVVFSLAEEARKLGMYTVRFNFRGVGKSTGTYDNTIGETADLKAAIQWVLEQTGAKELYLGGFSFGSRVILRLLDEGFQPNAVVMAGLPIRFFHLDPPKIQADYPVLFIQGEADEFTTPETTENFLAQSGFSNRESVTLPGCDHYFNANIHHLKQFVHSFLISHLPD